MNTQGKSRIRQQAEQYVIDSGARLVSEKIEAGCSWRKYENENGNTFCFVSKVKENNNQ